MSTRIQDIMNWCRLLNVLISWLVLLPVLLLACGVFFPLFLWRQFVNFVVGKVEPNWIPIFPPGSVHGTTLELKVGGESDCFNNFGLILCLREKGSLDVNRIRDVIKSQILDVVAVSFSRPWKYWEFRVVPKRFFGYYFWAPVDVDLEKHIWEYEESKSEYFEDYLERWGRLNFLDRAAWEILLATSTRGKYADKSVIAIKANHCMSDLRILKLLVDTLTKNEDVLCESKMPRKFTTTEKVTLLINLPRNFWKMWTFSRTSEATTNELDTPSAFITIDLKLLKSCVRLTGCSFRDVVCCTFASAVRRLIKETSDDFKVQRLGSMLVLPWPHSYLGMQNVIGNGSVMLCPFTYPMDIDSEFERLNLCTTQIKEDISNGLSSTIYYFSYLSYILPAPILKAKSWRTLPTNLSTIDFKLSSLPLSLHGDSALPLAEGVEFIFPRIGHSCDFGGFLSVGDTVSLTVKLKEFSRLRSGNVNAATLLCIYFKNEVDSLETSARLNFSKEAGMGIYPKPLEENNSNTLMLI